eukprot:TRINITY_DN8010_c0_g1_i1.p1 TRINITY_DN8010_c0_g1~~TRINITY_DN8010_c0_g1_i1.p1  ORF type:complete len:357 (+),score=71.99 TRINITY_DN8010_c0_g1_i1:31-1071(+)
MDKNVESELHSFLAQIRRNKVVGSFNVAKKTMDLLLKAIESHKWKNTQTVMELVKDLGKKLIEAQPLELAIGNVVKRVLNIIREEYKSQRQGSNKPSQASFYNLLNRDKSQDFFDPQNIKASVVESIKELIDEISNTYRTIAEQAIEHIHTNEIILTFGKSQTVERFLIKAAKKRKFQAIVVESAPSSIGQQTALSLSKHGIETTFIPDSAVFAIMARVNKVIVGTHAVMANGGLISQSGMNTIALAAKYHSVPFVVCVGLYKLSPLYPYEQDSLSFNNINTPASIMNFEEAENSKGASGAEVSNPTFDYIPPELVSLFVTNFGAHNPSYVYRLLSDHYDSEDYLL